MRLSATVSTIQRPENSIGRDPDFYITGPERSGTTLVAAMLSGNPETYVLVDTMLHFRFWRLRDLVERMQSSGSLEGIDDLPAGVTDLPDFSEPISLDHARWFLGMLSHGYFATAKVKDRHKDVARQARYGARLAIEEVIEQVKRTRPDWRGFFALIFAQLLPPDRRGATLLGEKSPGLGTDLTWLLDQYPDRRFVVTMRHPVTTVASMYRRKGGFNPLGLPTERFRDITAHYHGYAQQIAANAGHERVLIVRYEDVISEPEGTVDRVFGFLGHPQLKSRKIDSEHFPGYVGKQIDPERDAALWRSLHWAQRRHVRKACSDTIARYYPDT